jgi:molybdenum cofactor cytidylyltransferase
VLVALADQPLINSQDISDLIGAYKKRPEGAQVVQPLVDGLPGNPVMFSREVCEQILAGEARVGCKQWQTAHPDAVYHWPTTNQRYRTDVDSPQDIEALASRTGHRLRWPSDLAEMV